MCNNQRQLEANFTIIVEEVCYHIFATELCSILLILVCTDYILRRFPHPDLKILIIVGTNY